MNSITSQSRFRACLLGGAVGDALGAPVEFMRAQEIFERFGPLGINDYVSSYGRLGAITDDTQMTLFTAEGLIRGWVRLSQNGISHAESVVANAYLRWLRTQGEPSPTEVAAERSGWLVNHGELFHRRAPGNTCLQALREMTHLGEPACNDSKGCGGVMRMAPVGLFLAGGDKQRVRRAFEWGCSFTALTHGHPSGILSSGVFAASIAVLASGDSLQQALDIAMQLLTEQPHHEETLHALERSRSLAASASDHGQAIKELGGGWVAEEALAISVYCALVAASFEDGVVLAVNHDGDSDSTGSIAGNLLGAAMGIDAIPPRWLEALELRDVITTVADDLYSLRHAENQAVILDRLSDRYPGN